MLNLVLEEKKKTKPGSEEGRVLRDAEISLRKQVDDKENEVRGPMFFDANGRSGIQRSVDKFLCLAGEGILCAP